MPKMILKMGCEMSKSYARNGLSFISKTPPETLKGKKFFYASMLSYQASHCPVNCPLILLWGNRNLPIYQRFYALTVLLSCKKKLNPFYDINMQIKIFPTILKTIGQ